MPEAPAERRTPAKPGLGGWWAAAALIVVLDQLSKTAVDAAFQYGERRPVLPFFDFTLLYNRGAAFSFLADGQGWQRWLFTAIALVAVAVIVRLMRRHRGQYLFCAALTAIMGGALGNVLDRLIHGHVIDFLLFYWDSWHFPAFNIADISITCGAVLLVLDEIRRMRRERQARQARKP